MFEKAVITFNNRSTNVLDYLFPPKIYDEGEIKYWDNFWAKRLDDYIKTGTIYEHDNLGKRWLYDRLIEKIELAAGNNLEGKSLAEFGGGGGYTVIRAVLTKNVNGVIIDASSKALEYAYEIAKKLNVEKQIEFIHSDIGDLKKTKSAYDVVFNSGVLEHYDIATNIEYLNIMSACTKPKGVIFTALPNLLSPVMLYRMISTGYKGSEKVYNQYSLRLVYEGAKLDNSKSGYVNSFITVDSPMAFHRFFYNVRAENWLGYFSMLFYRYAIM